MDILEAISKRASKEEALKQIEQMRTNKINETKKQQSQLQKIIREYGHLVKAFENIDKKKKWQEKRADLYRKRLAELKTKANSLGSLIEYLESDSWISSLKEVKGK